MLSKPGCCHAWRPGVCMWLGGSVHDVKDDNRVSDLVAELGDGVISKKGNMWGGVSLWGEGKW